MWMLFLLIFSKLEALCFLVIVATLFNEPTIMFRESLERCFAIQNAVRDEMRPVKLNLNITPIRRQLSTVTQILAGIAEYLAFEGNHNPAENKTPYLPNTGPECHHYIKLFGSLRFLRRNFG
jgi:hypothetical protein